MSWIDRLRQAAYTSPAGDRLEFDYEDVAFQTTRRTKAYEFPDTNGTYIQELGHGGRRHPMRAIFWGSDHDLEADAFYEALLVQGIGRLEHPLYGVIDVVPFGDIEREDKLKSGANQTIIKVVFWEASGLIFPQARESSSAQVLQSVSEYNDAQAQEFSEFTSLGTASERATFKSEYEAALAEVEQGLASIAATKVEVERQFNAVVDSINLGIDVLVSDPLTLAFQTVILMQAPARASAAISDRLDAYGNLLNSLMTWDPGDERAFRTTDLFASAAVSAPVVAAVNTEFLTKTDALLAAEELLGNLAAFVAWRDTHIDALEVVDTGGAYQQLQEAVAVAAGYLVEISFTLKREKRVTTTRARTAIDMVAELYGEVDGQLDFFIQSNKLTGSEILEIPKGREIVYYV